MGVVFLDGLEANEAGDKRMNGGKSRWGWNVTTSIPWPRHEVDTLSLYQ
jgi:hypothetical protein